MAEMSQNDQSVPVQQGTEVYLFGLNRMQILTRVVRCSKNFN